MLAALVDDVHAASSGVEQAKDFAHWIGPEARVVAPWRLCQMPHRTAAAVLRQVGKLE